MQVYIDVIWLLNFLFDSLLLLITGIVLKRTILIKRIFFAGFIGSLVIFAPFTPVAQILTSPIVKIIISIIMVWLAFGYKRFRFYFSNLCIFYLITFCAGGALIGVHYLLNFDYSLKTSVILTNLRGFGDPISWLFIVLGFPILLYFSRSTFDQFDTAKIKFDQIVKVKVILNHETIQLRGLVDSGNHLYDPISKKPVMIVSIYKHEHLFPQPLLKVFNDASNIGAISNGLEDWMNKIAIIPYKVVGGDNRLIAAVKPEKVIIHKEETTIETKQVLIAFVPQNLSSDDLFDCIVHPKLMIGETKQNVS